MYGDMEAWNCRTSPFFQVFKLSPTLLKESQVSKIRMDIHNTTQHNTTQHNTTQHNTTQHNTTQHNTTHHNTSLHNTTHRNTSHHNTTQHITTQHITTQHNTTQHNTTQHNTTQNSQYRESTHTYDNTYIYLLDELRNYLLTNITFITTETDTVLVPLFLARKSSLHPACTQDSMLTVIRK